MSALTVPGNRPAAAPPAPRLLSLSPATGYAGYRAASGPLPLRSAVELIRWSTAASLSGRGGSGFPLARKISAVMAADGDPVLLVNWCEGDPTSAKDLVLAQRSPQLVLDGLIGLAAALRARRMLVAAVAGSPVLQLVGRAVAERPDAARVELVGVPSRFVASEASSLVSLLNTGDARPLGRLAPIWQRGVGGSPTLVANAETMAQLAVLNRIGPAAFAAVGTADEPGTALVSIGGRVTQPGVVEIPTGTLLADPLAGAGAPRHGWALVGGLAGGWIELDALRRLPFSTAALRGARLPRGVGSITAIGEGCILTETAGILDYLAAASAGRCGPCMFGLPAIAADMAGLAAGERAALDRLRRRLPIIDGRGGCAHPDGAVALAGSALGVLIGPLTPHLEYHLRYGGCQARPVLTMMAA